MFWCICAECGIKIYQEGKLIGPSQAGGDLFDTAVGTATDLFVHHGLPWMGKKAVEMGRYYGSEALRNSKLQKNAIDYALDKLNPVILVRWLKAQIYTERTKAPNFAWL